MSGVRIRPALRGIPTYKAGRAGVPHDGKQPHKLSSNENPFPPLPQVVDAAERASRTMNRYPDATNARLLDALSEHVGVPADRLAAATGSVALVYHLLQATCEPGDEVVYAWRSFEAFPIATQITGATSRQVPLRPDGTHDLDAMLAAVNERTRVIFACTPNNPTGPIVRHADLRAFCDRVPDDVLIVVDEAYREYVRDPGAADGLALAADRPNVAVLRTFSKAYGLAGFRVGFVIADEPVARAVRACALPFGVSVVAQEAAIAALGCEPELLERVEVTVAERDRVVAGLRARGFDPPAAEANFCWLPLGPQTDAFAASCEQAGVIVRPFSGDGCRISIGTPEANDALLDAAGGWRGQG